MDQDLDVTGPDDEKTRSVTIVDVARHAEVAVGTVSKFLNGQEIRRANRERIETAIHELGYRRNSVAAAMKTNLTHVVGLMVPSFDEFHGKLLEYLAHAIRRSGRALLIFCHGSDPKLIAEGAEFFSSQRIDALIANGGSMASQALEALAKRGFPVIVYNNDCKGLRADRVFVENRKASHHAVSHLLDLGHKRVGIITGSLTETSAQDRLLGYEDAMRERGLEIEPHFVANGNWSDHGGAAAARRMMNSAAPPTAIFTSNYLMAIGALGWFMENNITVPKDVSLISFDDVPLFRLFQPGITAISQPIERLAETITSVVVDRLASPGIFSGNTVNLDCDMILRGSTRRIS